MKTIEQEKIFGEWVNQYKSLLFKVVRAYTDDKGDQDDLFQEICIQVWRSIPNFRYESKTSTWIYKIALNTAMKWLKIESKFKSKDFELLESPILNHNQKTCEDPRIGWIYKQIYSLPKADKSIALLLLDGFSYKELAEITGLTVSNVGVKINRIKKYLIEKSETYQYEI